MSTSKLIKVSKSRLESANYLISSKRSLGTPLIIDVHQSFIDAIRHTRPESSQDVTWLTKALPSLGFSAPLVLSSREEDSCIHDNKKFFTELEKLAQKPEMTTQADVFVCIILAFGGPGYFYLSNRAESENMKDYKVQLSDVIDIFKADHCYGLVCKPKVFIIHTDDHELKKYKPHEFGDLPPTPMPGKVPVEADILVYQSEIAALYNRFLARKEPDDYDKLVAKNLAPGRGGEQGDGVNGTHFIWMLCKAAEKLSTERKFDMFRWIFLTNHMVDEYIKSQEWETWKHDKWTCPPRIPTSTCQFTRNIVVPLPHTPKP